MIKYRVQYVEKCNQKQRFWFICSENIKSILRRRNLDVKFVVECLALNENCRIIPTLILEQDLICADFVGKILELVALVGIMKNLAQKQETNMTKRPSWSFDRHFFTQFYLNIFSKIVPENSLFDLWKNEKSSICIFWGERGLILKNWDRLQCNASKRKVFQNITLLKSL